jgi:hypothetical protein
MHLAIFNNHTKLLEAILQYKQIAKKEFRIYICKVAISRQKLKSSSFWAIF